MRRSRYRMALLSVAFALIYACTDILLNRFAFYEGWTILWPLNGITIAILLMRPRAEWPWILAGVGFGTGVGECTQDNTVSLEIWLRLFSVTEIFLSAYLLPPFKSLSHWLSRPKLFTRFATALIVGPGLSGICAAILFHHLQQQPYLIAFDQWAVADGLGIIAFLPLGLAFNSPEMRDLFRPRKVIRTLAVLSIAFAIMSVSISYTQFPLLFLVFPTLLVVDLLLSFPGAAIACAVFCCLSVYLTVHSYGIFGLNRPNLPIPRDVAVQFFLAFQVVALFPASVLIRERRDLVDDLNSSNAQLLMLASLDGLTGLYNRRSLDEQFDQEWKRAIRLQTPIALIMVDVDHFKQFNDLYGHQEGDETLRLVSRALSSNVHRAQDCVARYGGEEFALLLPHTDLAGTQYLGEAIRRSVLDLKLPHEKSPWKYVTVSLGCASVTPIIGMDQTILINLADAALYEAKAAGRNCLQIAAPEESPSPVDQAITDDSKTI